MPVVRDFEILEPPQLPFCEFRQCIELKGHFIDILLRLMLLHQLFTSAARVWVQEEDSVIVLCLLDLQKRSTRISIGVSVGEYPLFIEENCFL